MKLQKLLWLALLVSCIGLPAIAHYEDFDLAKDQLFVPHQIATTPMLCYREGDFYLTLDDTKHKIASYNVRGFLSDLSSEGLDAFLKSGYFAVGGDETEYTLQWKGRVLGGGISSTLTPTPSPTFPQIKDPVEFEGKNLGQKAKNRPLLRFHSGSSMR